MSSPSDTRGGFSVSREKLQIAENRTASAAYGTICRFPFGGEASDWTFVRHMHRLDTILQLS